MTDKLRAVSRVLAVLAGRDVHDKLVILGMAMASLALGLGVSRERYRELSDEAWELALRGAARRPGVADA